MGSFLFSIVYQRPKNVSAPDFHIPKVPFMIVPFGFAEGDGQLFFFGIGLKRQIDPGIMRVCRAAAKYSGGSFSLFSLSFAQTLSGEASVFSGPRLARIYWALMFSAKFPAAGRVKSTSATDNTAAAANFPDGAAAKFNRARAAHEVAGDKVILRFIRSREPVMDGGHPFAEEIIIHVVAKVLRPIGIEGVVRFRITMMRFSPGHTLRSWFCAAKRYICCFRRAAATAPYIFPLL